MIGSPDAVAASMALPAARESLGFPIRYQTAVWVSTTTDGMFIKIRVRRAPRAFALEVISWEVLPHFFARFVDVFGGEIDIEVGP